jgi:hypothetical protein
VIRNRTIVEQWPPTRTVKPPPFPARAINLAAA